jgi:hypothetical protein
LQCCDGGDNGECNSADAGDYEGDDSDNGAKMLIVKVVVL